MGQRDIHTNRHQIVAVTLTAVDYEWIAASIIYGWMQSSNGRKHSRS